jgi:polyphosphate glucokinase
MHTEEEVKVVARLGKGCEQNRRVPSTARFNAWSAIPTLAGCVGGLLARRALGVYNRAGFDKLNREPKRRRRMKVLVVDVGGTNVKLMHSDHGETRRFRSGKTLTPEQMIERVNHFTADWPHDVVSLGLPVPIKRDKPAVEPKNLGTGWKDFDFSASFHQPVKVINDAALQALGSYHGGRMLFLGLGTGLGSTLIVEHSVVPLELGRLQVTRTKCYEDFVSDEGLAELGLARWRQEVYQMVDLLTWVFLTDYVIVGGGNAKKLGRLPHGVERGHNRDALEGGIRLWEMAPPVADAGGHVWKVM